MALIVESGRSEEGATSYVALLDARAFVDARGLALELSEALLLRAMDALEVLRWRGTRTDAAQALAWPRRGLRDATGASIAERAIPRALVEAQIHLARYIAEGADPSARVEPAVRTEIVGPIETTYAVSLGTRARTSIQDLPAVQARLRPFLVPLGRALVHA